VRQTASCRRLYVMDRRQKQKLERDLERYHVLLKLATDERGVAALKQLIREMHDRLNHINNSEKSARYENSPGKPICAGLSFGDHLRRTLPKLLRVILSVSKRFEQSQL
jgi:hypothetical protein